jgi:ubiquinone/menaquinone biosynthesis C-methylase UbiE
MQNWTLLNYENQQGPGQSDYWDRVALQKRFTHPLPLEWLSKHLDHQARILDYGCGYGRILQQLVKFGYSNCVGIDFSEGMLTRCRSTLPRIDLIQNDGKSLPFRERAFDAVVLFSVLTCVPCEKDQRTLLTEVRHVLRPGGLLYISDLLMNSDRRNVERYERDAKRFGVYGIFELPEGVIVRHQWIEELTSYFVRLKYAQ